jgi:hypothetical protein
MKLGLGGLLGLRRTSATWIGGVMLCGLAGWSWAGTPSAAGRVTLLWEPHSEPGVADYRVYFGESSGVHTEVVAVEGVTEATLEGLEEGVRYYVVVTAVNGFGLESLPSEEFSFVVEWTEDSYAAGRIIRMEAEAGVVTAPMVKDTTGPGGLVWVEGMGADGAGSVALTINVGVTAEYVLWCRVRAPSADQDSFHVSVDGGAEEVFHIHGSESPPAGVHSPDWIWARLPGAGGDEPRLLWLEAGMHTLRFRTREAGTGLDRILLSSDADLVADESLAPTGDLALISGTSGSQTWLVGQRTRLGVSAVGSGPLTYQWFKNGSAIAGANGSFLDLTDLREVDGGDYVVKVGTGSASVWSDPMRMAVVAPVATAVAPQQFWTGAGAQVWFEAGELLGQTVHVLVSPDEQQWELLATVVIPNATVTVSDPGAVQGEPRFYQLAAWQEAMAIDRAPADRDGPVGGRLALEVEAAANGPIAYQWLKFGEEVPGANGSTLVFDRLREVDGGEYSVRVSSGGLQHTTAPVTVAVRGGGPRIVRLNRFATGGGPAVEIAIEGRPGATMGVFASSDLIKWDLLGSGVNVAGSLTVTDPAAASARQRFYRVAAPNEVLEIDRSPQDAAVLAGGGVALGVKATANRPIQYQWFKDDLAIEGATGAQLLLAGVGVADAGSYHARVSIGTVSLTSTKAALVIAAPAPKVLRLARFAGSDGPRVRLALDGAAGHEIQVHASTDLERWSLLGSALNDSGSIEVKDPLAGTADQRFYRVVALAAGHPSAQ